jgi:UTP--glucose-1-phosphate uridylyltransferase
MSDAVQRMRDEGLAEAAVRTFADHLERLRGGERGVLAEADIEPVAELPDADDLPEAPAPLDEVCVLKLNGGLGTSMGMEQAKSLLEVKPGTSFLDLIARQVLDLRARTGAQVPLVLMNSFATSEASMAALARHEGLDAQEFLQHRVPKLDAATLEAVSWPADPALEWAPPGHGDLYAALVGSGMLAELLGRGIRYAFVSNADNLGATLDERVLAWFAAEGLPFLMEVADRTAIDKKGGHLARRRDGGGLVLREIAQTPDEDVAAFQDVARHRFFNTNTLWLDLQALDALLRERGGVLGLPMIVNRKTVDPKDAASTPVLQLETAMGAAIDVVEGARAIRVPRTRFAPVKTTNDLLVLRSDAYVVDERSRVQLDDRRAGRPPLVDLDPAHFKLVGDFEPRFAAGAPSLVGCESLTVRGDVRFGAGVVVRGDIVVDGADVPDGAVLEG